MDRLTRRRFLSISAGLGCLAGLPASGSEVGLYEWNGIALGADAQIRLVHPRAEALMDAALAEIRRLEGIFSLYRSDSALSHLNAEGALAAPPFELLDVLALASQVHQATGGAFDPTVQSLWRLYAESWTSGIPPSPPEIAAALSRTGLHRVRLSESVITLEPGTALTLNGIAQGYISDRIAALFRSNGVKDVLVDTGEIVAAGNAPEREGWPVRILGGPGLALRDSALATSSPLGTCFDQAGTVGHILDPRTGLPARPAWKQISIGARSAALADACSTAACLARDAAECTAWFNAIPGSGLRMVATAA